MSNKRILLINFEKTGTFIFNCLAFSVHVDYDFLECLTLKHWPLRQHNFTISVVAVGTLLADGLFDWNRFEEIDIAGSLIKSGTADTYSLFWIITGSLKAD